MDGRAAKSGASVAVACCHCSNQRSDLASVSDIAVDLEGVALWARNVPHIYRIFDAVLT